MNHIIEILSAPENGFLLCALAAGALGSIAFGIVGTLVVTRNLVSIGGAVAHAALGGIGAACYFRETFHLSWCHPMLGAVIASMIGAWLIGLASLYARQREDTVIGAIWAVGMAAGLMFLNATPGYADLNAYLFGNILMLDGSDLIWLAALDGIIVFSVGIFHNRIFAVIFDREFAALRGIRADRVYLFVLELVALTVVLMVNMVGVFMVIALLALPAAAAEVFSGRLSGIMVISALLCCFFTTCGIGVSFCADWPAGPVIVLLSAACYLAVLGLRAVIRGRRARTA